MFNSKISSKMTKRRFNLRKVATIVACLVVTMMFVACDKTNPDDDNGSGNGNGGGSGDERFVGVWTDNPENPVATAPRYIEFKSDGSYYFHYRFHGVVINNYINLEGILTETGKYTIKGDKIQCSNIKRSVKTTYGNANADFTNKSYSNCERSFSFDDKPHWLYAELDIKPLHINMRHPSENPDYVSNELLSYIKPIDYENLKSILGWSKELPDVLYPTGLTGIVTTNYIDETITERLLSRKYVTFTVKVNSKDRDVINPYFEKLRQNGFAFPYGTNSNYVYKSMTICGARYEVCVNRNHFGLLPDVVVINFTLEQYDEPSFDWEWD